MAPTADYSLRKILMWDDVIIGSGNRGSSAHHVFAIRGEHGVSENPTSFWISRVYLGLGMTIFKDTREGKKLAKMIADSKTADQINAYLKTVVLRKAKPKVLMDAVDRAINKSFEEGREDKVREILQTLRIGNDV